MFGDVRRLLLLLLAAVAYCTAASIHKEHESGRPTCGYESCTKSDPSKINIHLVAHTHDDVGWLKTVDQYYFGGRMNIQVAGVQYIIDSVVDSLVKNPARKFIYVETAFLWKWWLRQDDAKRDIMRQLINEGRLEIIGGGWSMNDEATTHYRSMLDQYTWGFRRLNDTFGECARPKIGWQIDPFGHSREQASMFAQLGFDGLLFGRLDYQDKSQRLKDKTAEFVWEASSSLGRSANLFTSVLYNAYSPPPGFCFDILCQDAEPMIDDHDSPDYNIEKRVAQFLEYINKQSNYYRTNNLIITMGGDFTYQYAEMYLKNLDKLISGINKLNGTRYKAFYSTPSCYLKAVNEQNLTWPTKGDDFFPYASDPHAFWTGYFTSRPTLKFFERMGNNFLQVVKQLSVITRTPDSHELELFREAMGVMQHHDAVTGTEKQHVADDYARILHHSITNAQNLASKALRKWLSKSNSSSEQFHSCLLLNISSCEYSSENSRFVVTVYNPTSQPLNTYVRLPVADSSYSVKDFSGKDIVTQVVPIAQAVLEIPGRPSSRATKELVFQAVNIAPLGYRSFYVSQLPGRPNGSDDREDEEEFKRMKTEVMCDEQGNSSKIRVKTPSGLEYEQSLEYYESQYGPNGAFNRSSGAYVFRPKYNSSQEVNASGAACRLIQGPLVHEVQQRINDWLSQVVRVYQRQPEREEYVEFNWLVGPIPLEPGEAGREVIARYASVAGQLDNRGEFHSDSNGREMLKRKLNERPSWPVELDEPVSGNYYPVNAKISIEDELTRRRMSVLTDRSQGGSSLRKGHIELMVHRRLVHDDGFGVAEALNELAYGQGLVARGQHIVIAADLKQQNRSQLLLLEKDQALGLSLRPWLFVTPCEHLSFQQYNELYSMKSDADDSDTTILPNNVRILTLEPWKDDSVLLRLEHLFEVDESPNEHSLPTQFAIDDLFPNMSVLSVVETNLGANQRKQDSRRFDWSSPPTTTTSPVLQGADKKLERKEGKIILNLKPMEIRTFVVKLSPGAKRR